MYEVVPNIAGFCSGNPENFNLTIQPLPTTQFSNSQQTICTQSNSAELTLSSTSTAVDFEWEANVPAAITGVTQLSGNGSTIPAFTLENNSNLPQTITFSAKATTQNGACQGPIASATITVLPTPSVDPIAALTICNNQTSTPVTFSGVATGYNWNTNNTATGTANNANNVLEFSAFMATNNSTAPILATINVTPIYTLNATTCQGEDTAFVLTVNPTAQVNNLPNIEVCNGDNIPQTLFSTLNTIGTTTYNWTNSNTAIGLAANGTQNIPAFNATNTTNAPINATITISPSFTHNGTTCTGPQQTFSITVNPTPVLSPIAAQTICNNQPTAAVNFSASGTTNITWTNDLSAIGLATTGNGNIPAFNATNTSNSPITATLNAAAFFNTSNLSCPGNTQAFTFTINPTPSVDAVQNQILCVGEASSAVNFSGSVTPTTYNWTSSNTNIGLSNPSGTNNIPTFTAINQTNAIVSTTITITPTAQSCLGTQTTFTLSVNPTPAITNTSLQQTICPGTTTAVNWTSSLAQNLTANYNWVATNVGANIGGATLSGTGNLPQMTLSNTATAPQTVVYNVTPSFGGCSGNTITYTITVNPGPVMDPVAAQEICSQTPFNTTQFTSNITSTTYQWNLNNTSIPATLSGYPTPNGNGNITGAIIENTGSSLVTLNYEIFPTSFGCQGASQLFNLTIQPELNVIFSTTNQTICDGEVTNGVNLTSNSPNTFIHWSIDSIPQNITGVNQINGTGFIPVFSLGNTSLQTQILTFTAQAFNSLDSTLCPGEVYFYTITVNPSPNVNPVANQVVCHNTSTTEIQFTGSGTTYEWQNSIPGIGLPASGTNILPSFNAWNNNTSPQTATITATPFFTLNGVTCAGSPTTFDFTVNQNGQINPIPNIAVCNGDSVPSVFFSSVNSGGSNSYSWSNLNSTTGLNSSGLDSFTPEFLAVNNVSTPNISNITVTPTFTNLGVSCVGNPTSFNITVNATPLITSTNDTLICNSTLFSVAPTTNVPSIFAWQGITNPLVSGITTNLQNGINIQNNLVNSSPIQQVVNYLVTPISSPQGCTGSVSNIAVTVQPDIQMTSPTSYEICSGTLVYSQLTSNIPSTYTWFATNNPNISGASTFINSGNIINDILINSSPTPQQIVYTIIPTSIEGSCQGAPLLLNVLVYPELQITTAPDHTICTTDQLNILLNANASGTYSWFANPNGNVTGISTSIQNTSTITDQLVNLTTNIQEVVYNVVVTSNNQGCTSQNYPITVEVSPLPTLNQLVIPDACVGQLVPQQTPAGIYSSINWVNNSTQNGQISGETNVLTFPAFTAQNPTNSTFNSSFELTPLFTNNGVVCEGVSIIVPFTVQALPEVDFNLITVCDIDTIWTDNLSNINYTFVWEFGDGNSSINYEPWHIYDVAEGVFNVTLTITNPETGCVNSLTQTLSLLTPPIFEADTTIICSIQAINFTNQTPSNVTAVIWDFGDGQYSYEPIVANHTYTNPGCYDVTLSFIDQTGCPRSTTIEDYVCILESPTANLLIGNPIQIYNDNQFDIENLSTNATVYFWDFGDGNNTNMTNPTHIYDQQPGYYAITLVAFNEIGCSDTAVGTIQLIEELFIYVPNTFTPNNSGTNDVFLPIIDSGIDDATYKLQLFNRWGEMVFESKDKTVGWDGTYRGSIVQDGIFTWKITFKSPDNDKEYEYIGHVNLLK